MTFQKQPKEKDFPKLPIITKWGAYDPVTLMGYFVEAEQAKMNETQMAQHLRVPLHRILYFRNARVRALQERRVGQILDG